MLGSWQALLDYLRADMAHEPIERVRVLFLNAKNVLIANEKMWEGSVDESAVYIREIMRRALDLHATAIIVVHNHPSGDPSPSQQDIRLTRDLAEAGRHLKVTLHDHVIIGASGPFEPAGGGADLGTAPIVPVIPAKAGISFLPCTEGKGIPASAGMTTDLNRLASARRRRRRADADHPHFPKLVPGLALQPLGEDDIGVIAVAGPASCGSSISLPSGARRASSGKTSPFAAGSAPPLLCAPSEA